MKKGLISLGIAGTIGTAGVLLVSIGGPARADLSAHAGGGSDAQIATLLDASNATNYDIFKKDASYYQQLSGTTPSNLNLGGLSFLPTANQPTSYMGEAELSLQARTNDTSGTNRQAQTQRTWFALSTDALFARAKGSMFSLYETSVNFIDHLVIMQVTIDYDISVSLSREGFFFYGNAINASFSTTADVATLKAGGAAYVASALTQNKAIVDAINAGKAHCNRWISMKLSDAHTIEQATAGSAQNVFQMAQQIANYVASNPLNGALQLNAFLSQNGANIRNYITQFYNGTLNNVVFTKELGERYRIAPILPISSQTSMLNWTSWIDMNDPVAPKVSYEENQSTNYSGGSSYWASSDQKTRYDFKVSHIGNTVIDTIPASAAPVDYYDIFKDAAVAYIAAVSAQ